MVDGVTPHHLLQPSLHFLPLQLQLGLRLHCAELQLLPAGHQLSLGLHKKPVEVSHFGLRLVEPWGQGCSLQLELQGPLLPQLACVTPAACKPVQLKSLKASTLMSSHECLT